MRVVLDTNVLMSGIFFPGPPATILATWAEGELELLASMVILTEYRRVGDRLSKKYPSVDLDPVLDLVIRESRIVEPVPINADACGDEDDLKFLEDGAVELELAVTSYDRQRPGLGSEFVDALRATVQYAEDTPAKEALAA